MKTVDERRLRDADLYVVYRTDHEGEYLPIDHYRVEPGPYYVDLSETGVSCDCDDHAWRNVYCKHILCAMKHSGWIDDRGWMSPAHRTRV